ncbi:MAG: hypothetical protein IJW71_04520 [Clostridia bacterium]|nr:hypothetical protein [Clostridia bacterium]
MMIIKAPIKKASRRLADSGVTSKQSRETMMRIGRTEIADSLNFSPRALI